MERPLALFDIDNTIYDGISYFPLLETQIAEGLIEASFNGLAHGALGQYQAKLIDYEDLVRLLLDIYAVSLQNKPAALVQRSTDSFFAASQNFFGYVAPTMELLAESHEIVLVTGGSDFMAKAVAKLFGIQKFVSSVFEKDDGILNGRVESHLATRHDKKAAIEHLTNMHAYAESYGFGDSEADIEMLRAVEYPICIRPTPGLADVAEDYGWTIITSQTDLDSRDGLMVVRSALDD